MRLAGSPLFGRLAASDRVLIAGAGGGFDVFCGLPLALALLDQGKTVAFANLSFTHLAEVRGRRLVPEVVEVTAHTPGPERYFPERAFARALAARGRPQPVYALQKTGCVPLTAAYRALQAELGIDTVVLVDGGTDLLMRGDEAGLGTPAEDITSLAAVDALTLREKLVVCLGFGVDRHHGICHAHFLENVAGLAREGAFLGVTSLLPEMPEVRGYLEAVARATDETPDHPSIVSLSVASAIVGAYGDVHRTERTRGSKLWINPLMSMYWAFDLAAVAKRCLYLEDLRGTQTVVEVAAALESVHQTRKARAWEDIPV